MTPKASHPTHLLPELDRLSERVIGAAIEVHRIIGPGHLESVYEAAFGIELGLRGLAFERQLELDMSYKNVHIGKGRVDLLVERSIVVELKAVESLLPIHQAQLISYLKLTSCKLGLLINFNSVLLKDGVRRLVHPATFARN